MKKRQCIEVESSALADNERLILKLIFSVSERARNREHYFQAADEQQAETAKIFLADAGQNSLQSKGHTDTCSTTVFVADRSTDCTHQYCIQRPLIATRVLSVLDKIVASKQRDWIQDAKADCAEKELPVSSGEAVQIEEQTSVGEQKVGATSLEFSITEEEASELAIVHDETLANPANEQVGSDLATEGLIESKATDRVHTAVVMPISNASIQERGTAGDKNSQKNA